MPVLFTNNASARLASSISISDTTILLSDPVSNLFPGIGLDSGDYFFATLANSSNDLEIVKVTSRTGNYLTVIRGQEGTSPKAYMAGDLLELRLTAMGLNDILNFVPSGTIEATTLSGAIRELDMEKAGLDQNNVFTGTNTFVNTPTFNKGFIVDGTLPVDFSAPITFRNAVTFTGQSPSLRSAISFDANTTVTFRGPVTSSTPIATDITGAARTLTTVLPVSLGGTGLTAPGPSGNVLTSNGTTWISAASGGGGGGRGQAFTTAGTFTFTIPTGITAIKVTLVGGGAGGGSTPNDTGSFAGGGGAGAVGVQYFSNLTPGNTLSVTVGSGGGSNTAGGTTSIASGTQTITTTSVSGGSPGLIPGGVDQGAAGGAGGSTFVNTLLSFPGGAGGNGGGNSASGGGGSAGGGPGINSIGGGGAWGQGAAGVSGRVNGNNAVGFGNGGSGGGSDNGGGARSGGSGSGGLVLIEW